MVQKHCRVLWPSGLFQRGKVFYGFFYRSSVQKPASLMVWGYICTYGMGSLHVLEGTMNAERYLKVLEQHMLPPR